MANPPTPPGSTGCEGFAGRPPVVPHFGSEACLNPLPPSANWAQPASWHLPRTKIITMTTCTTPTSQKAVSMGPRRSLGRPKSIFYDFGVDFGIILGFFFHQNFDSIIRKWRKCEISEEYNAKRASKPSKTFDLHIDFSSKLHVFSKRLPKRCFVRLLAAQGHQKVAVLNFSGRFWRPLGF